MNVKELRSAIIRSTEWAQKESRAPQPQPGDPGWMGLLQRAEAERDRLRWFLAHLSGRVQEGDPQLSAALAAFLQAEPGEPLPGQAAPAPDSAPTLTPPSPREAA